MKAEFQDFADQMLPCKGRRTKRPRASPPVGVAVDSSPSRDGDSTKHPPVGAAVDSSPSEDGGSLLVHSPASSCSQMSMATQEDENMAHCLILLARSAGNDVKVERISCQKSSETDTATPAATVTVVATATSVYECKTCNRKFPSFQALGGHRASHSKPKLIPEDHKKSTPLDHQEIQDKTHEKSNKTKIHECLICGSLFYSGQALGGHMRRHRPLHINTTTTMKDASMEDDDDKEKPKPVFTLDLNLPAPDDDEAYDEDTTMFEFSDKQQSSAFSTSAMVDCHY